MEPFNQILDNRRYLAVPNTLCVYITIPEMKDQKDILFCPKHVWMSAHSMYDMTIGSPGTSVAAVIGPTPLPPTG